MKKILTMLLMLLLGFGIVGCDLITNDDKEPIISVNNNITTITSDEVDSFDKTSVFVILDENLNIVETKEEYINGTIGTTNGTYILTCTYNGVTEMAIITVTSKDGPSETLTYTVKANNATKSINYTAVATLDLTSLFTIKDSNGNNITVLDSYISGSVLETAGTYTITCTYQGSSATCKITVINEGGQEETGNKITIDKAAIADDVELSGSSTTYIDENITAKLGDLKITYIANAFGYASKSYSKGYYDAGCLQLKASKENLYSATPLEDFSKIEITYLCTSATSYTPANVYYGTSKHPLSTKAEYSVGTLIETSYLYSSSTIYSQTVTYTISTGNNYFTIKNTSGVCYVSEINIYGTPVVVDTDSYKMLEQTNFTTSELATIAEYLGTDTLPFPTVVNYDIEIASYYGEEYLAITFNTTEENLNNYTSLLCEAFDIEYDSYYDDYYGEFSNYILDYYFEESEDYEGLYLGYIDIYTNDEESEEEEDDPSGDPSIGTSDLVDDGNGYSTISFNTQTVKNVHDIADYEDGMPTVGDVKVLVIPVDFSDAPASTKGYTIDKINAVFNGPSTDSNYLYYSVKEYLNTSSYGQLNVTFDICDEWFRASKASSYYEKMYQGTSGTLPYDIYGYNGKDSYVTPEQIIMNDALAYLDTNKGYDLSDYDSDDNGTIDAVVLVYSQNIDESDDSFFWAWRYWNLLGQKSGSEYDYYYYDNVSANDYLWVSYQFMFESSDGQSFNSKNTINTYTFIHEFSHVLGADDYYDYSGKNSPMEGLDVMDYTNGDHTMYTKMWLGWVNEGKIITTSDTVTLTLHSSATTKEFFMLANTYDTSKGIFQEYYIVEYYTNTANNTKAGGYFDKEGIVVHHINSSCSKKTDEYGDYYTMDYNNNDKSYDGGTKNNLIELVKGGKDYIYTVGEELGTQVMDDNSTLAFNFKVDSIADGVATLTFTRNK